MSDSDSPKSIRLKGVRHNNLKNFDLDIPMGKLTVVTGLSGSGKSSLAFDTLFAEGQRRYVETFSPYARQFFDRMDKPQVDSIEGIPPAIAIEQRNSVKTSRSTVGTMTEICDHMKVLWSHLAQQFCAGCGKPVRKDPPSEIWKNLNQIYKETPGQVLITFDLPLSEKLSLKESLDLIGKQGYRRILTDFESLPKDLELNDLAHPMATGYGATQNERVIRIEEAEATLTSRTPEFLTVVQDRVELKPANRKRFVEACEQAYHFGKGKLRVLSGTKSHSFSKGFHCAECDQDFREPSASLFSFNNPVGACPECRGFGRIITVDFMSAIPDRTLTLAEGAVKPWQTDSGEQCQRDMMKFCKKIKFPTNVSFNKLTKKQQEWVIYGDPDYGIDDQHRWPQAWYGIKGYFDWLESKAYKMHVRVMLSRYRAYIKCPSCQGKRFNEASLHFRLKDPDSNHQWTLPDFYALPIEESVGLIDRLNKKRKAKAGDPIQLVLKEVLSRLTYLNDVGLGYLTLDRTTRTLSGGETERVNLTTCLGTRLVNTLFVLDELSVGLHAKDTDRLIRILHQLRDSGNTVVVVEHEESIIRAADHVVDLGPRQGEKGGQIVFDGSFKKLLKSGKSLTADYLTQRKMVDAQRERPVIKAKSGKGKLILQNAKIGRASCRERVCMFV